MIGRWRDPLSGQKERYKWCAETRLLFLPKAALGITGLLSVYHCWSLVYHSFSPSSCCQKARDSFLCVPTPECMSLPEARERQSYHCVVASKTPEKLQYLSSLSQTVFRCLANALPSQLYHLMSPLLEWLCPKPKLYKSQLFETLQWSPLTCRIHVNKTTEYRAFSFGLLCFCSHLPFYLLASISSTHNH